MSNSIDTRNFGGLNKIRLHIVFTTTIVLLILKILEVDPVSGWSWWAVVLGPFLTDMCLFASIAFILFTVMAVAHLWSRRGRAKEGFHEL